MKNKKMKLFKNFIIYSLISSVILIPATFIAKFVNTTKKNNNYEINNLNVKSKNTKIDDETSKITNEIKDFKLKNINLISNFLISGKLEYSFAMTLGVEPKFNGTNIEFNEQYINVDYEIVSDNTLKMSFNAPKNLGKKVINFQTAKNMTNNKTIPWGLYKFGAMFAPALPQDLEFYADLNLSKSNITTQKDQTGMIKIKDFENLIKSYYSITGPDYMAGGVVSSFISGTSSWVINTHSKNGSLTFNDSEFWKQNIKLFNKDEIIKWFNFIFNTISEENKKLLKDGPDGIDGREWNLSDLNNGLMPSFLVWSDDVKTLIEADKIEGLVNDCIKWQSQVQAGSGWASPINKFYNSVINGYKFDSYDELLEIYTKYYKISIENPDNSLELDNFIKWMDEKIKKPNNDYELRFNKLNQNLSSNGIKIPNINSGEQLPSFDIANEYNKKWQSYKLLSYLLKGILNSNDLICDITATVDDYGTKTTKDVILYSSTSNDLNNIILRNAMIDVSVEEGGKIQNISISNVRFKNNKTTKFLNINSTELDSSKLTKLSNNLKSIQIKFNANALDFAYFNYETWTKNKDAVGLDINKYLTQIINIDQKNSEKELHSFINEETKKMVLDIINGNYSYVENNVVKNKEKPAWLVSNRQEFSDYKQSLFDQIYSISNTDIQSMLEKKIFNTDDWNKSLSKFNIKTDDMTKQLPIFVPNQTDGEFFVIGKIDSFHKSSNYKTIKNNILKNNIAPIVLINENWLESVANPNGDGYFLVKLKACFQKTYNFDITNNRNYEIYQADGKRSIKWSLEVLVDKIMNNDKYWINDEKDITKESFFNKESWTEEHWKLNKELIWYDMLSDESPAGLILDYDEKQNAINYFKKEVNKHLESFILEKYGNDSEHYKSFIYYLNNFEYYDMFFNAINDDSDLLKELRPFIFSKVWWNVEYDKIAVKNNIKEHYQIYLDAISEQDPELKLEKQKNSALYNWLIENEKNPNRVAQNNDVLYMIANVIAISDNIFNDDEADSFKIETKNSFIKFLNQWNDSNNLIPSGGNGFADWKQTIQNWIQENDASKKYKNESEKIFLEQFNNLLDNFTNFVYFNSGSTVNNNLIFSSIKEMINDPVVKIIFEKYNIKFEDVFVEKKYEFNGTVSDISYYELKENLELDFNIHKKTIDDVEYWTISNVSDKFTIKTDLELLNKISEISYTSNNKKYFKVTNPNRDNVDKVLKSQIAGYKEKIDEITNNIKNKSELKKDYKSVIKIESIVLVTLIPATVIMLILIGIWLLKTRKSKGEL